jgi:hypothetical protein
MMQFIFYFCTGVIAVSSGVNSHEFFVWLKIQGTEGGVEETDGESVSEADSVKDRPGAVQFNT